MNFKSRVLVCACGLALLVGMATVGGLRLAHGQPANETKPAAEKAVADYRKLERDLWAKYSYQF